jgi:hypothetical protein
MFGGNEHYHQRSESINQLVYGASPSYLPLAAAVYRRVRPIAPPPDPRAAQSTYTPRSASIMTRTANY